MTYGISTADYMRLKNSIKRRRKWGESRGKTANIKRPGVFNG
jgi:hypothetical protein